MSRTPHRDNETKPPTKVLVALKAWLKANGLTKAALARFMSISQTQTSRVLVGGAYLSATQRRAIEEFTGGAITAAMLEGKAPPPPKAERRRPTAVERSAEKLAAEILAAIVPMIVEVVREEIAAGRMGGAP
jgi:hypothetical protein